jgi:hypothetical protein
LDERRPGDADARPQKLVGVYDRPRVRRSSRILLGAGVVVVAIVIVLVILLR